MSVTVLITGIGGDIAQGVATILKECRPDYRLVGVDLHIQHGGHLLVDAFEVLPGASDPQYFATLRAVIEKYSVNIVIPMTEPELGVLYAQGELPSEVVWVTAGRRVVLAGLDKFATAQALEKLGIPAPWTDLVEKSVPRAYPCIFKSRYGTGSRAVFKLLDVEDAEYFSRRYPDAVYQEFLEPAEREVTCAVYRNRAGDVCSLLMLRRLTGGFTGWATVIKDAETEHMCLRIAEGLDLRGGMNVQLRLTEYGPRVFEINPRFSSTVLMRHRLGFSDVLWAIDEAEGKALTYPSIPETGTMVRVQAATVFDVTGIGSH